MEAIAAEGRRRGEGATAVSMISWGEKEGKDQESRGYLALGWGGGSNPQLVFGRGEYSGCDEREGGKEEIWNLANRIVMLLVPEKKRKRKRTYDMEWVQKSICKWARAQ